MCSRMMDITGLFLVQSRPIGLLIKHVCSLVSLTGVSPFAGENDRCSVMNIRNYNVAFEESMFAELCKEAKGFIIKLLVSDRL